MAQATIYFLIFTQVASQNEKMTGVIKQQAGDIAALNSTTTCEAKHIYCVHRDEGPEAKLAGSLQR